MSVRFLFAELLYKCSKHRLLDQGKQIHGVVEKLGFGHDLVLNNDLIDVYAKCGNVDLAFMVFDRMPQRNVVSWTALMCGYLQQNGDAKTSLHLFSKMGRSAIRPNEFTLSTCLKASGVLGIPENGMQIHGVCAKFDFERVPVVGNSLIDMYSKCGRVSEAARVFNTVPVRNIITWNAMIAGYTYERNGKEGLNLFRKMREEGQVPDEYTYSSTLKACSCIGAVGEGKQVHASLIRKGFPYLVQSAVAAALVDLYVKCRRIAEATKVFNQIEHKNVSSWSTLILGYAQEDNLPEAMNLFGKLRESRHEVDGFVLSSLIGVFADFALVDQGKQMHAYTIKVPYGLETSVANSVLDMYMKCGFTDQAEALFREMLAKNVVSWTVMITGYGKHGVGNKAVELFNEMQVDDGIQPDSVTCLAVLSACSHSGLIKEGQQYFSSFCSNQQIKLQIEHYACMIDLLGRAGRLEEAKDLIEKMPMKPNVGIWQTLLSVCRMHGEVEMGKLVGEMLLRLDGNNPANYVMMSNMYADAGYWKESERIRDTTKRKGLKKDAGRSWVEIDKEIHIFYNGDSTHPLIEKIHQVLREVEKRMKEKIGYVHNVSFALHDVEEESKVESLRVHSEKLAIGLALARHGLKGETTIRVFKNLRVCVDCHAFIKGLSKVLNIVFVVRDANRFHRFESGLCSCGDYW